MTETVKENDRSVDQAHAQVESIVEMMDAYHKAEKDGEAEYEDDKYNADTMREIIEEKALSVEVRSDWHSVGTTDEDVAEFRILLCTGGPAVQIVGTLGEYREPDECTIQHQDWFTAWADYAMTSDQNLAVLEYCQMHYFGE